MTPEPTTQQDSRIPAFSLLAKPDARHADTRTCTTAGANVEANRFSAPLNYRCKSMHLPASRRTMSSRGRASARRARFAAARLATYRPARRRLTIPISEIRSDQHSQRSPGQGENVMRAKRFFFSILNCPGSFPWQENLVPWPACEL